MKPFVAVALERSGFVTTRSHDPVTFPLTSKNVRMLSPSAVTITEVPTTSDCPERDSFTVALLWNPLPMTVTDTWPLLPA